MGTISSTDQLSGAVVATDKVPIGREGSVEALTASASQLSEYVTGGIDDRKYDTLTEADAAAVSAGRVLIISKGYSVPVAATLNADVCVSPGGYIDVAGALNVNGNFDGGFNCLRGNGSVVGLKKATPEMFGAVAGGTVECSAAVQKAVNAAKVTTARGLLRCDTPILLGTGKTLVVEGELKRITAYSASTRPVVIINNTQLATLRGDGGITTQNACPQGVVLIGPEDPAVNGNQTINNEWNKVLGVSITGGSTAAGNIGIKMQCTNGWSGDKVAYMNKIAVNEIHTCGTGIHLGAECNGNFIHEFSGWNLGQYGIRLAGADGLDTAHGGVNAVISISDNVVQGAITHASPTLVATLQCESAYANKFNGMHGEPGSGKLFHFDAASNHNVLFGMENHPNLGTDLGTLNTIITDKMFKTNTPCFLALNSASDLNVTGDGTTYQIICDNEIKDKTDDYGAGGFTARVGAQYRFTGNVYLTGLGAAHTSIIIRLVTSNRTYLAFVETVGSQPRTSLSQPWSVEADMDAGDTAFVTVQVSGGAKTVNVFGGSSPTTTFSGSMIL